MGTAQRSQTHARMNSRARKPDKASLCACGSDIGGASCCLPYIELAAEAPSAQALMRSRYTAYTLNRTAYLLRSWHPRTRPAELQLDGDIRWLGLKLKHIVAGQAGDAEGSVEFIARFKIGSRADRIHEISRFVFENGRWLYLDGVVKQQPRMRPDRH